MSRAPTFRSARLALPGIWLSLALLLGAAAADDGKTYNSARQDLEQLLKDPVRSRQREPYERLMARFDAIARANPAGPLADRAAYQAARTAEELSLASRVPSDLDLAMQRMQKVAADHPSSRLADDALLAAARMALERRSDPSAARAMLIDLQARFPHGDMVGAARELLARLPKEEAAPVSEAVAPASVAEVSPASPALPDGPVDRIGELLKKAELIRAQAGDAGAPQAAVLEAEAALRAAEMGQPLVPVPGTMTAETVAEVQAPAYTPAPRKSLRSATDESPARLRKVLAKPVELGLELQIQLDGEVTVTPGEAAAEPEKKLPRRVYFDLTPAKVDKAGREVSLTDTSLSSRVRCGQNTLVAARVVIELQEGTEVLAPQPCAGGLCILLSSPSVRARALDKARESAAAQQHVARTEPTPPTSAEVTKPEPAVARVSETASAVDAGTRAVAAATTPEPPADEKDALNRAMFPTSPSSAGLSLSQQVGLQVRTVVIDPGHGGNDPGAIGPTGLREKDVTLKLAKRVAARLEKEQGLKVVLTRDRDKTLSLEERAQIANDAKADLFLSIHVNASPNRKAYGIETFYLNTTDDRYAIRLAARENAGSEKSIGDLQFILADLVTKSNVDDSRRLARAVQSNMIGRTGKRYSDVKDLGLKSALFYVLIGVRMPSVLVESSFISHRREEKRLRQDAYLDTLADGIVRGVRDFTQTQTSVRS